ncbi:MAG: cyclic pyranopterin monophosphate synthase MoaC [Methylacidiphilales bacterium]|nr:cyclic pyranopterin monophosphate synthase MoaC [Candidatus Methylacidiphilales bacterium]
MKKLSHLDASGNAHMVDVSAKPDQLRRAVACGELHCSAETIKLLKKKALPKGDVLTVAQIAGIQAAKQTSALIPLCHPLPLHQVSVEFKVQAKSIQITASATTSGKTGVEMEALTAVAVACLTLYDMLKAVDKKMRISGIKVIKKMKG